MKRLAIVACALALSACATTRGASTSIVLPVHKTSRASAPPSEPDMRDPFGEGYRKALEDFRFSIQQPFGPYARNINPVLVARPPKIVRVYTNMIRVGRMIYPEGWYYMEVHPGTPAGVPPRRR